MRTSDSQQLLARLYVDQQLLTEYLASPAVFAQKRGVDVSFIDQIDYAQLVFFAGSLVQKRANEAMKLVPMVASALGCGFSEEFTKFAASCIPSGHKKHAADAMAFCRYLINSGSASVNDAARFDLARLRMGLRLAISRGNPAIINALPRRLPWLRVVRVSSELREMDIRSPDTTNKEVTVLFVSFPALRGIWYW